MEDHAWSWSYQESNDELRQKLAFLTLELESVQMKAHEEMKRSNEAIEELKNTYRDNVTHLLDLLKVAYQERDEAKLQIQKLLNMLVSSQMQPDSIFASSSISESNTTTFSDCFLEGGSCTDFPNMSAADAVNVGYVNQSLVQNDNSFDPPALVYSEKPKMDAADILIDSYVKGKPLPEKGRLYEAVLEAGPLLETLLVATDRRRPRPALPRWRNPPPMSQVKALPFTV